MGRQADLNPSLGLPTEAGPCYLAWRVFQRVKNPRLRDQLIHEIEEGGKEFDGRDEKAVYKPHKERGPAGNTMYLLPHAQRRMDERGITVVDLRLILENWLKWWHREKSMQSHIVPGLEQDMARGEKVVWEDRKYDLTVIFRRKDKKSFLVVTAFWTNGPRVKPPGSCGIPRSASGWEVDSHAAAVLIKQGPEVLVVRRGITAPWMPNAWTLPVGGVEEGEEPWHTAIRETIEELGVVPLLTRKLGIARSPGEGTVHVYEADGFVGALKLDYENDMVEWVTADSYHLYGMPRLHRLVLSNYWSG